MSDEAKRVAIHWRRVLFGFHLLVWLIARLAVGSIDEMPPAAIYDGLEIWGLIVFAHGLLLAVLDARDHADLPAWMHRLINPRERRFSLLAIDAAVWVIVTTAIASRQGEFPAYLNVNLMALAWLTLTAFGIFHILLVIYGEIRDASHSKRKKTTQAHLPIHLALADDGELIDFDDPPHKNADHN